MSIAEIEILYPKLCLHGYVHTSNEDPGYNCFAHALNDNGDWYSYLRVHGYYWPPTESAVPRDRRLNTFIKLFNYEGGFDPCDDGRLENGVEKVALYMNEDKKVTHAARQLPDGKWTSKLGVKDDVTHELGSLEDPGTEKDDYGTVVQYLKRDI